MILSLRALRGAALALTLALPACGDLPPALPRQSGWPGGRAGGSAGLPPGGACPLGRAAVGRPGRQLRRDALDRAADRRGACLRDRTPAARLAPDHRGLASGQCRHPPLRADRPGRPGAGGDARHPDPGAGLAGCAAGGAAARRAGSRATHRRPVAACGGGPEGQRTGGAPDPGPAAHLRADGPRRARRRQPGADGAPARGAGHAGPAGTGNRHRRAFRGDRPGGRGRPAGHANPSASSCSGPSPARMARISAASCS
jgi:hypothetical protein